MACLSAEEREEALGERVCEILTKLLDPNTSDGDVPEPVFKEMMKLLGDVYLEGYHQGQHDEALAQEFGDPVEAA